MTLRCFVVVQIIDQLMHRLAEIIDALEIFRTERQRFVLVIIAISEINHIMMLLSRLLLNIDGIYSVTMTDILPLGPSLIVLPLTALLLKIEFEGSQPYRLTLLIPVLLRRCVGGCCCCGLLAS